MSYSFAQLEGIWIQNGGNKIAAPIAAAIAMAESGGNPNAVNHNSNGSTDRGLWQINSVHGSQSTFDVNANAKAAIAISGNGTDWQPWVTFQTGAYRKFLSNVPPEAVTAADALNTGKIPNQPSSQPSGVTGPTAQVVGKTSGGIIGESATLLHDAAEFLNFFFQIFHPGQAWRAVMGVGGVASGAFAIRLYRGDKEANPAAFPLAVLLTGVAVLALYMAFRPWPVGPSNKPIRPAPYVTEILQGKAPTATAPANDTGAIEVGLAAILGVYVASKVAGSLGNVAGGVGGIVGALGKLFGKTAKEVETGVEDIGTTAVESGA